MTTRRDNGSSVTAASIGGRTMNRDDVTTGSTVAHITWYRAENTLFAGFRQGWISGEDPDTGTTFDLASGAGLGSAYLTLTVQMPDGTTVNEYVDVRELLQSRVGQIIAEHQTPPDDDRDDPRIADAEMTRDHATNDDAPNGWGS